jgi:hypothetical protein
MGCVLAEEIKTPPTSDQSLHLRVIRLITPGVRACNGVGSFQNEEDPKINALMEVLMRRASERNA